jgi:2',3'-cyclic-nucleotide 2'-phosphodiesterase / 3'-nucleotidase
MYTMIKIRSVSYFLLLFFLGFSFQLYGSGITVQIVTTTDVHGHIFPYDFVNNRPQDYSLAHVHHLVSVMRSRQGSNVILLDNGDLIQGTPAAYYANFKQDSKKNLFARVLNYMKYDAATVGNHDIEAGPDVYKHLQKAFDFPWLGANVINESDGKPFFKPYTVIRKQRINIVVLGLTTPGVPNWLPPHLWEGLVFEDMIESAAYWMNYIKENESPDAIIGLFHSGRGSLQPLEPGEMREHASAYIAKHVPGFDVIFTGHDHRQLTERIADVDGGDVILIGGGHFAEHVAVAELVFDRVERRVFVLSEKRAEVIPIKNISVSHAFINAFEEDASEIIGYANQSAGQLSGELSSRDAFFGPAPFVDLIHHVQLKLTGADISFSAPLAFDVQLKAGRLLVRDFFSLYQYENYLYTMQLSGQEILDFLEYSYGLWFNHMQDEDDYLLYLRTGRDGQLLPDRSGRGHFRYPFYNFDSAAGIRYIVDVSKAPGERISIEGFEDGRIFDTEATYKVAVNSYRGSGGGGHLTEGAGIDRRELKDRILSSTGSDLRTELINYFLEQKTVHPVSKNNWKLVPEEWVKMGSERERKLLFVP